MTNPSPGTGPSAGPGVSWQVRSRRPFAGGRAFGSCGPFEVVAGRASYAVDPADLRNAGIVDLDLAPTDGNGLVRFEGDYALVAPRDPAAADKLLIDVPNRGRPLALAMFNAAPRAQAGDALAAELAEGDGWLFRRGFSVASIGWQWDVVGGYGLDAPVTEIDGEPASGDVVCRIQPGSDRPSVFFGQLGNVSYPPPAGGSQRARLFERNDDAAPMVEVPRNAWRFARQQGGLLTPSDRYIHKDGGFAKGRVYVLAYRAERMRVVGCGLLALREAAASLRRGNGPNGAAFRRVFAFGASQTGRVLRHLLHLGLTADADGGAVFDGMHIHIAGGQRGDFNHRGAQPSSAGVPGPGQRFPFAGATLRDPLTGVEDGLYRPPTGTGTMPKVVITNTSWEYWRGDAALTHVSPDGRRDLPPLPYERNYLFAGTHHIGGVLPPTDTFALTGERARHTFNTVDHAPLARAAFANLDAWASANRPPPPSMVPTLAEGTLVDRAAVLAEFAAKSDVERLDPARLGGLSVLDLGGDVDRGICRFPAGEGAAYARLVAAVDDTLNEAAGVRLPDIAVPIGCHTGWNPRHPQNGAPMLPAIFVGFSRFADAAQLPPRPDYEQRVRVWTMGLVAAGYLLAEDQERVVANAVARYDIAAALPSRTAT